MSHAHLDVTAVGRIFRLRLKRWLKLDRHRLYQYRPRFRNRHFWLVQGLVLFIAFIHNILEADGLIQNLGVLYFLPLSMLLVPVIYAALNFGFAGAMATAMWATVITIPNFIFEHQGLDRFFEIFQMLVVIAVAFFVGRQVDRERGARQRAENAGDLLRASEMKYRGLFESCPIALFLFLTPRASSWSPIQRRAFYSAEIKKL